MKIAIKSPSITTMEKGLILHLDFLGTFLKMLTVIICMEAKNQLMSKQCMSIRVKF
jgi:hypothetical protein